MILTIVGVCSIIVGIAAIRKDSELRQALRAAKEAVDMVHDEPPLGKIPDIEGEPEPDA